MLYLKLLPIIFFPVLFWIIPHPEGVAAPTWHMVGIYLAMLCGLVLRPFTDAVIMLIILGFASLVLDPAPWRFWQRENQSGPRRLNSRR